MSAASPWMPIFNRPAYDGVKRASVVSMRYNMSIKTLSLFSGCGGLDLGIEGGFQVLSPCVAPEKEGGWVTLPKLPFSVEWANDIMPQAQRVWNENFEGEYVLNSIVNLLDNHYAFPKAELVVGGFPCQDFSLAGKRKGFSSERGQLYQAMAEVLKRVQPKAFIAENVYGLLSIEGALETITRTFANSGYVVHAMPVTSQDFGVPQTRQRILFVGIRSDLEVSNQSKEYWFPKPTHAKPVDLQKAFWQLEEPEYTDDVEQRFYSKARWYGKGRQGNTEVTLNAPGPTMRAEHHGNIEFRRLSLEHGGKYSNELNSGLKERRLTVRECARIQSFPDHFKLMRKASGEALLSASSAYKVLGNAVPPLLAYRVAHHLASRWEHLN
jgi:DNA (cytosine-5)-methyltransferase 1